MPGDDGDYLDSCHASHERVFSGLGIWERLCGKISSLNLGAVGGNLELCGDFHVDWACYSVRGIIRGN